jgi:uncharacterized membrane protein
MLKLIIVLLIGMAFESAGIVLLKKGITQIGDMHGVTAAEIFRVVKLGATNPQILIGVFFEAIFFICLMVLMSKSEISFLWPLTSLSFVFATISAIIFLGENVSLSRWIGVVLIVIGAGFISYSERAKEKPAPQPMEVSSPHDN